MSDPVLVLLAGPNGAGKSTLFARVIEPTTHLRFVNADAVAAEWWPETATEHAYEAAAIAAAHRDDLIANQMSFATETVFSHPSKVELIETAKAAGYIVLLHIVIVPEDLAVARVADRVTHGGHGVPEEKIRTRYRRLWGCVQRAVELADETRVYDNSKAAAPFRLVAQYRSGILLGQAPLAAMGPRGAPRRRTVELGRSRGGAGVAARVRVCPTRSPAVAVPCR